MRASTYTRVWLVVVTLWVAWPHVEAGDRVCSEVFKASLNTFFIHESKWEIAHDRTDLCDLCAKVARSAFIYSNTVTMEHAWQQYVRDRACSYVEQRRDEDCKKLVEQIITNQAVFFDSDASTISVEELSTTTNLAYSLVQRSISFCERVRCCPTSLHLTALAAGSIDAATGASSNLPQPTVPSAEMVPTIRAQYNMLKDGSSSWGIAAAGANTSTTATAVATAAANAAVSAITGTGTASGSPNSKKPLSSITTCFSVPSQLANASAMERRNRIEEDQRELDRDLDYLEQVRDNLDHYRQRLNVQEAKLQAQERDLTRRETALRIAQQKLIIDSQTIMGQAIEARAQALVYQKRARARALLIIKKAEEKAALLRDGKLQPGEMSDEEKEEEQRKKDMRSDEEKLEHQRLKKKRQTDIRDDDEDDVVAAKAAKAVAEKMKAAQKKEKKKLEEVPADDPELKAAVAAAQSVVNNAAVTAAAKAGDTVDPKNPTAKPKSAAEIARAVAKRDDPDAEPPVPSQDPVELAKKRLQMQLLLQNQVKDIGVKERSVAGLSKAEAAASGASFEGGGGDMARFASMRSLADESYNPRG